MPLNQDERREVEKRIHRSACFQRAFSGADGILVLGEIMQFSKMYNDTFDPDPHISSYNQGRRSVGIFINNCIEQNVEKAKEMLENASDTT